MVIVPTISAAVAQPYRENTTSFLGAGMCLLGSSKILLLYERRG